MTGTHPSGLSPQQACRVRGIQTKPSPGLGSLPPRCNTPHSSQVCKQPWSPTTLFLAAPPSSVLQLRSALRPLPTGTSIPARDGTDWPHHSAQGEFAQRKGTGCGFCGSSVLTSQPLPCQRATATATLYLELEQVRLVWWVSVSPSAKEGKCLPFPTTIVRVPHAMQGAL